MLRQHPGGLRSYAEDSRLPLPDVATISSAPLIVGLEWRINGVSDGRRRRIPRSWRGGLTELEPICKSAAFAPRLVLDPGIDSLATGCTPKPERRERLAGEPDQLLILGQGSKTIGKAGAIGQAQVGIELEQRHQDEAPGADLAVGQDEALTREFEIAEQEQIDVERTGTVAGGLERPTPLGLRGLADFKQRLGVKCGSNSDYRVEEIGLIEQLANRRRLIGRGDRVDHDAALAEQLDRGAQVCGALADV